MTTTLTRADINSGNAVDIGYVQSRRKIKDTPLDVIPTPGEDSTSVDVYDDTGPTERFELTGIKVFDTAADAAAFEALLDQFQDGQQNVGLHGYTAYADQPRASNWNVKIENVDTSFVAGDPVRIYYTIRMTRCSTLV